MPPQPFRTRKLARRIALVAGLFVLLMALVYLLAPSENVWLRTKHELEARGEILDWEKFIPPEIPSAQNLFDHPMAASLLPVKGELPLPNPLGVPYPDFPPGAHALGYPFTIATLKHLPRESSPTNEITLTSLANWFERWDQSFAQLREAGQRPSARLPGDYSNPTESPIPSFVQIRTLAQVLASRAKVHLLLGDSAAALEDLDTIAVLLKALDALPATLVSAMIQVAVAGLYIDVVEEGLREHLWRDSELKELIPRLSRMDLIAPVQHGIRAERAAASRLLSALADRRKDPLYAATLRDLTSALSKNRWSIEHTFIRLSPAGWVRRNQAHLVRLFQAYIDAMDPADGCMDLGRIQAANKSLDQLTARWSPHTALVRFVTPSFSKAAIAVVRNQTRARQAAIACAIERFRLRNNHSPDNLTELIPDFIDRTPDDLFTGKSMAYDRTSDGWELSSTTLDPTNPKGPQLVIPWSGK